MRTNRSRPESKKPRRNGSKAKGRTKSKVRPGQRNKRVWAYGELTIDDIIDAALNLVAREGTTGLSMRSLATELGLSLMAVYHYIPTKEALFDHLINRVLTNVSLP